MPRTVANLIQYPLAALPRVRFRVIDVADLILTWMEVARQRRHLASLDDRMLRDIGFSRADVEREVDRAFWDVGPRVH